MTIKDLLFKFKGIIGSTAKRLITALMNANLINITKAGVLIGSSITTVMLALRHFKNKRRMYKNEVNKSPVDRALQINYSDLRNQDELGPLMRQVKKRLTKDLDLKPRNKKIKVRKSWSTFKDEYDRESMLMQADKFGPGVLSELEKFKREMEEIENDEARRYRRGDRQSLRDFFVYA